MSLQKVLITGDAGTVGQIARSALFNEYEIVGYDKSNNPRNDINNRKRLEKAMRGCRFVIHSAAIPHPSQGDYLEIYNTNIHGTFNVLSAALSSQVNRVILISSIAYYGIFTEPEWQPQYFPIDEGHPPFSLQPGFRKEKLDIYGQSKVIAEQLTAWFGTNTTLKCIALRLARVGTSASLFSDAKGTANDAELKRTMWSNIDDPLVGRAIKRSLEYQGQLDFEAFNIVNKQIVDHFLVEKIIEQHYKNVPIKKAKNEIVGFFSVEKAEEILGLKL